MEALHAPSVILSHGRGKSPSFVGRQTWWEHSLWPAWLSQVASVRKWEHIDDCKELERGSHEMLLNKDLFSRTVNIYLSSTMFSRMMFLVSVNFTSSVHSSDQNTHLCLPNQNLGVFLLQSCSSPSVYHCSKWNSHGLRYSSLKSRNYPSYLSLPHCTIVITLLIPVDTFHH